MKIKAIGSRAGPKVVYDGGKEYEVEEARALRMIQRGHAVAVSEVKRPETKAIENAEETQALETTTRYRRKR